MADQRCLPVAAEGDVSERPSVALCVGKDCRQRCEFAKVRKMLAVDCDVVELKCVGLCNGPVVVTDLDNSAPDVYCKLRSKSDRRLLRERVTGDRRARKKLVDKRVARKKVLNVVSRQLRRVA